MAVIVKAGLPRGSLKEGQAQELTRFGTQVNGLIYFSVLTTSHRIFMKFSNVFISISYAITNVG